MDDGLFMILVAGVGFALHWALKALDGALARYRMKKEERR